MPHLPDDVDHLKDWLAASPVVLYALRVDAAGKGSLWVSESIERITGYTREEALRPGWWERNVHPADVKVAWAKLAVARSQGHQVHEYRFRHADGRWRWIRDETRGGDADGGELVGSWSDITEQREAERSADGANRHTRALLENVTDVVFELDARGVIRSASRSVKSVLGLTSGEVVGRTASSLIHEEDRPLLRRRVMDTLVDPEADREPFELRALHSDGSERVIEARGSKITVDGEPRVVVVGRDTSPVRHAMSRLQESEQRYRSLLEHNPNPVYEFDSEGRFTAVNAATEELTGRSAGELIGGGFIDLVHPDDLSHTWEAFQRAWAGETAEYELRVLRPDGSERQIRGISAPTKVDGRIVAVYGIATDETERIEEQAQREQLEERLHQAQKMQAVGRLAGGVAHDFNNLLTGLRGLVGLRLEEMADDDAARPDLEEVDRIAERASALVRQLLAFSRNQVLRMQVLDVNELVRETDRMLGRVVGEDIRLETELVPEPCGVRADPAQLQQVIINLVVNARQAMPGGGRIWLRTRTGRGLPDERGREQDVVVLEVEDSGVGISKEIIDQVFDPFFTTKAPGEGTGLGLSTVYGVVQQSRGDVSVESEIGRGTTFRIVLPRHPVVEEAPAEHGDGVGDRDHGGTVLVVEDESTVRRLIARVLERSGFGVVEAVSARAALEWMDGAPPFDLLISDVIMPGMSGPELVGHVRERFPDLPVLMISGYDDDRLASLPADGTSFLAKPFTPAELAARVRQMIARANRA